MAIQASDMHHGVVRIAKAGLRVQIRPAQGPSELGYRHTACVSPCAAYAVAVALNVDHRAGSKHQDETDRTARLRPPLLTYVRYAASWRCVGLNRSLDIEREPILLRYISQRLSEGLPSVRVRACDFNDRFQKTTPACALKRVVAAKGVASCGLKNIPRVMAFVSP